MDSLKKVICMAQEKPARAIMPYPTGLVRWMVRLPIWSYRLGLIDLAGVGQVLVLTTRGRKSGLLRYAPLEYRRHGSKLYVVSAWGTRPDWYQNLLAHPQTTARHGRQIYTLRAHPVTDPAEALRALNMFRRTAPIFYDRLLSKMSTAQTINLNTLTEIAAEFTVMRLDIVNEPSALPAIGSDRGWIVPMMAGIGVAFVAAITIARREN